MKLNNIAVAFHSRKLSNKIKLPDCQAWLRTVGLVASKLSQLAAHSLCLGILTVRSVPYAPKHTLSGFEG